MKIYLSDNEKLNIFNLPENINESFLFSYIPYETNTEIFLNITARDNNWYFKNDNMAKINDDIEVKLEELKTYKLKIIDTDSEYFLFTNPSNNKLYYDINIQDLKSIKIGKSSECNIIYENELTSDVQNTITEENGIYYIDVKDNSNAKTYINNILLLKKKIINAGDIIFINNLKLLWMETFIRVYEPPINIKISSNIKLIENKNIVNNKLHLEYNAGENDQSLYREENYFFHKPRLTMSYREETVDIDPPPPNELKDEVPLIFSLGTGLALISFSLMNLYTAINGYIDGSRELARLILPIVTSVAMITGSFVLPQLLKKYTKKKAIKKEKYRQEKYTKYLEKKQNEINEIIKYQSQTLYDNNISSNECYNVVVGNKSRLWEREIKDKDFLTVRVGLGNVLSSIVVNAPKEKFSLEEDDLLDKATKIADSAKELKNVPVTISFCENFISSIVCNTEFEKEYIDGMLLQLMTLHAPNNLKIIFLTAKTDEYKWEYLKLMPHLISDDKSIRFFSDNEEDTKIILQEMEKIYNERKDSLKEKNNELSEETDKTAIYESFDTYYLIITDNYKKYKDMEFLNKIMKFKKNIGFSLLMIEESIRNLPNDCNKYIYIVNEISCIFEKEYNKHNQYDFEAEFSKNIDMFKVARELSNIPIQTLQETYALPNTISFLEMYNVGRIEQLNILNKWNTSNPILSLNCPVGVHPSGELFKLDLHEKFHGPHGLIAGSTGSGKSEFIITYILSMAINFHPNEVQFVLIDYKGGGLAGAFENRETGVKIPHLAGTITNLDVSEMNRTLVSIESELKRRQKKFNEAREELGESTIDIYKYQKYYREGLLKEPIPHLFIISDEFAELKSQQPEFMDELISTARIGRSLGIHLILATQKPSGVVNDQIWSNSRFRVCLKVQTPSDSMEMLKRPDAASIKDIGRFYLQVGYDELFELGQSAWCGASYTPTDKVIKKVDDSISFISNIGEIIKSVNNLNIKDSDKANNGDQLTAIVKYLYDISIKNNIITNKLWLDNIPAEIFLVNLIEKYKYTAIPYEINPIIGEYDDPISQKQGLLTIDITKTGNTLVYGIPGSGKENLITTLVTSICTRHTTDEINIYILDFGAETLKKFSSFSQVGDVIYPEETEKLNNLYTMLNKEMEERKVQFANYSGSYNNFIKESDRKLPMILCIINSYENFVELYSILSERFINLFKDGPKFGINFLITNAMATGVRGKVSQLFTNKLSLKLNDPSDYRYLMDAPRGMIPSNHFGRGIIKGERALEFQTAFISKQEEINSTIKDISEAISSQITKKAPKVPVLPKFVTVDKYLNSKFNLSNVPVGITKNRLNICTYDFNKYNFTPIVTNNINEHTHFLYALIEELKQLEDTKIRVIDVLKIYKNSQGVDVFNDNFDTLIKQIKLEAIKDGTKKKMNVFIIIGLGAFKNNVSEKTRNIFNSVFEKLNEYNQNKFIVFDDYNSYKSLEIESWFKVNVSNNNGIWLGDNSSSQLAIRMPNLTTEERKIEFPQIGYVVKDSSHTIIRYIVDKEFDDEK